MKPWLLLLTFLLIPPVIANARSHEKQDLNSGSLLSSPPYEPLCQEPRLFIDETSTQCPRKGDDDCPAAPKTCDEVKNEIRTQKTNLMSALARFGRNLNNLKAALQPELQRSGEIPKAYRTLLNLAYEQLIVSSSTCLKDASKAEITAEVEKAKAYFDEAHDLCGFVAKTADCVHIRHESDRLKKRLKNFDHPIEGQPTIEGDILARHVKEAVRSAYVDKLDQAASQNNQALSETLIRMCHRGDWAGIQKLQSDSNQPSNSGESVP